VQPEGGAHRLRQLGHCGFDLSQGFPRGCGRLGRARPRIGRVRSGVEAGEQAPLEAPSARPVEGEVAHHPADIGVAVALPGLRRVGDEAEHHVLDHVLGLGRASEDAARPRQVGGAMAPGRGKVPRCRADRLPVGAPGRRKDIAQVALEGRHCHARRIPATARATTSNL
jgi:hypothetical protein